MSSIRKIQSSQANGARSRGPVTEPGKQISSQNARRHALLARIVVLENESPDGFAEVLTGHLERFQPTDGVEFGIVEEMVAAWWRMRRAWSIETQLLNQCFDVPEPGDGTGLLAAAFKNPADSHGLALLHRYEARLHGMYQRALKNLLLLQIPNVPNEPNPTSEHRASANPAGGPCAPDLTHDPQPPTPDPPTAPAPAGGACASDPPPGPWPPAPGPRPAAPDRAAPNEPNPISEHSSPAPAALEHRAVPARKARWQTGRSAPLARCRDRQKRFHSVGQDVILRGGCQPPHAPIGRGALWAARSLASCPA
jgi:hypothetical protein